jgi:TonB-dependent starch-binding outer membrane protein SusC
LNVFTSVPGGTSNMPESVMNRWRNEGDRSDVQLFTFSPEGTAAYTQLRNSTRVITDASYIRLKNLSVSYSWPREWIDNLRIVNARFFLQGQNLLTLTKYEGLDPETGSNSLPPLKVLSGGFHLTF